MPPRPADIDRVLAELLVAPDGEGLDRALRTSEAAGLPPIQVSPLAGKLLHLLATAAGARRILELGTLGGYSTIWLARALPPDGELLSVEVEPSFAELARQNLAHAQLAGIAKVLTGPALTVLGDLEGPFDFAFLDADKATMDEQLELVVPLMRAGGMIVCDNIVRRGSILDPDPGDRSARGARRALQWLADDPRVEATAIQTVGLKSHDGFALAIVAAPSRPTTRRSASRSR